MIFDGFDPPIDREPPSRCRECDDAGCPACDAEIRDQWLSLVSAEDATCSKSQQKAAVKGVKRMTLTMVGDRDSLGRCFFRLDWQQDGRDRGQYFFAVPEEHIYRLEADGYYVQILETGARLTVRDLADRPDLPHHDHTGVS